MLQKLFNCLMIIGLLFIDISHQYQNHHHLQQNQWGNDKVENEILKDYLESQLSKELDEGENKLKEDEDIDVIDDLQSKRNSGDNEIDNENDEDKYRENILNDLREQNAFDDYGDGFNKEGPLLKELVDDIDLKEEQDMELRQHDPMPWRRFRFRAPRLRLRLPRVRLPRIRLPRIRLPRIRLPRIRLPRIRLPRIRLRLRRVCVSAKLCKPKLPSCPKAETIESSIKAIRCDGTWKTFFEPQYQSLVDSIFTEICQKHTTCSACAGIASWSRLTCESALSRDMTSICVNLSQVQDSAEDKLETLNWCKGKTNKILQHTQNKAYGGVSYCKCLPDDFNTP